MMLYSSVPERPIASQSVPGVQRCRSALKILLERSYVLITLNFLILMNALGRQKILGIKLSVPHLIEPFS